MNGKNKMITFEEAREIVSGQNPKLSTEQIGYRDALYRILAEDVFSDMDMPPFHKSAMDGYACRKEDIHKPLKVIGSIPAGVYADKVLGEGECMRIMTGAPLPAQADCVIMVEHTEEIGEGLIRFTRSDTAVNICFKGEDVQKDQLILEKGTRLLPQHIAVLAATGKVQALVYTRPKVGILSSGDELVEPQEVPGPSNIRNSNAYQIEAQVYSTGALPVYMGIVPDDPDTSRDMIARALEASDLLLITGGVSAGDYDYIPRAMEDSGVTMVFDSLAVQPGRPTVFGTWNETYVFGLPGNPVSSFVQFELLVKPLIYAMMGHAYQMHELGMILGADISRKKAKRKSFLPAKVGDDGKVYPVEYHGSAHIHAYLKAHALMSLDIDQYKKEKGEIVRVRLLQ